MLPPALAEQVCNLDESGQPNPNLVKYPKRAVTKVVGQERDVKPRADTSSSLLKRVRKPKDVLVPSRFKGKARVS
jgi:hypothetical protein